jgi:hypothetical protein
LFSFFFDFSVEVPLNNNIITSLKRTSEKKLVVKSTLSRVI